MPFVEKPPTHLQPSKSAIDEIGRLTLGLEDQRISAVPVLASCLFVP